jgi:hypothetical protein
MNNILNVVQGANYDNSIAKLEYHSYSPFLNSFNNGDEIRISIQHQDLHLLLCESLIYIEGRLLKNDNTVSATALLVNNTIAYLFESIRYELNGIEIDNNKNVGHTSLIKNYLSLNEGESKMLRNAGWAPENNIALDNGYFNFCVPLKMLLGFAEDYRKIIINAKHELILTRTSTDSNAIISADDDVKFNINKIQWKVPHVTVADEGKLSLLKLIGSGKPIIMSFRSWDLHEYPLLARTTNHTWSVKTTNQLEKPRYVILALQTNRKNQRVKDYSKFDHCNLVDVKLHLNSDSFPYDDMNLGFSVNRYALLYNMYANFQQSYYGCKPNPLLTPLDFANNVPIVVIDCSHQNETIKSGPVDIRLEFKTTVQVSDLTSAYCLLIHDRIVEYNPLTNQVKKHI